MKRLLSIILSVVIIMTLVIASVGLTTIPVSSIKLNASSIKLKAGDTYTLKVTIAPANATNKKLSFSTGNKKVATVDKNGKIKGIIAGKTVITVTSLSNKKAVAKCSVTVTRLPLYKIQVFNATYADGSIRSSDETDIGKYIKEKFNIVFDFVPYVGDRVEKQNLMVASGDYPEMICLQGEDVFQKYLNAGAVVQLDAYLKDMPNFKKLYQVQIPYWRLSDEQGRLFKYERTVPNDPTIWSGYYDVMIRSDVLEKQGFPKLLSTSSYVAFLKRGLKDFPETNGKKTIGMAMSLAEDWGLTGIGSVLFEKGGTYVNLSSTILFNTKTNKYEERLLAQPTRDNYHFFNVLYREGLLDPEAFTDRSGQVTEKCNALRPIGVWYSRWDTDAINNQLLSSGKEQQVYVMTPVQSDAQVANKEKRLLPTMPTRAYESCVITKNARYPERLIDLIEWCCSDDGQRILQSGIEDKHWTEDNGEYKLTEERITNIRNTEYNLKMGGGVSETLPVASVRDAKGIPYGISNIPDDRLPVNKRELQVYKAWGGYRRIADYWGKNGQIYDMGLISTVSVGKYDPELDKLNARIVDYMKKNLAVTIVNPKNDNEFEAAWNKFIEGYKVLQPEKLVNEVNRQYAGIQAKYEEMKKK